MGWFNWFKKPERELLKEEGELLKEIRGEDRIFVSYMICGLDGEVDNLQTYLPKGTDVRAAALEWAKQFDDAHLLKYKTCESPLWYAVYLKDVRAWRYTVSDPSGEHRVRYKGYVSAKTDAEAFEAIRVRLGEILGREYFNPVNVCMDEKIYTIESVQEIVVP